MYIKMMLRLVAEKTDKTECAEHLKEAYDVLGLVLSDMRIFSFDLASPELTELGLETAIANWVTDRIDKNSSISTEVNSDSEFKPLEPDVESLLFRSVKELLSNAVRHSSATKIVVEITKEGGMIRISVSDNGIGFSLQLTEGWSNRKGLGLYSIRERMAQMSGYFDLVTSLNNGCEAVLRAPLTPLQPGPLRRDEPNPKKAIA
jgi:two-component system NarL family sensor kinase